MSISLEDIVPHLTKDNKNMFLQIVSGVSLETKEQNLRRSIIFHLHYLYTMRKISLIKNVK